MRTLRILRVRTSQSTAVLHCFLSFLIIKLFADTLVHYGSKPEHEVTSVSKCHFRADLHCYHNYLLCAGGGSCSLAACSTESHQSSFRVGRLLHHISLGVCPGLQGLQKLGANVQFSADICSGTGRLDAVWYADGRLHLHGKMANLRFSQWASMEAANMQMRLASLRSFPSSNVFGFSRFCTLCPSPRPSSPSYSITGESSRFRTLNCHST